MTKKIWSDVLGALEKKVSRANFITWLKTTDLIDQQPGLIIIATPNLYAKQWIEKNVLSLIKDLLASYYQDLNEVRVVVRDTTKSPSVADLPLLKQLTPLEEERSREQSSPKNPFNERYTFDNFIVGNNNRLAFAASQVVAEKPGETYNPLFIYGGVGLGKTHLMQAIGNQIWRSYPKKKILYTSCETFTSEFIQALRDKTINDFKKKYRTVDIFLVDDIQFLANKEGTQEEFFHTFNILHQANRQIVVTSDRVPKEIPDLEERLSSRFGWGMIADIQPPNFETRVAILQAKAQEKKFQVDPAVLTYIANTITANVRELEGSLTRLVSAAQIEGIRVIDLSFTHRILKDLIKPSQTKITTREIIKAVSRYFNIETTDLLSKKQTQELVYPRQLVMYLLREELNQSFPQIGETLGGKDHTTIIYGVRKISRELKNNSTIDQDLRLIKQQLYV